VILVGYVDQQYCKSVKDNYAAILKILSEEIYNNNDMDVAQAIGKST